MTLEWTEILNPTRRRPTTMSGDVRDEFERDYDRSVFSTPSRLK